jgi:acetylornithine deacetylase/succinyl-diaminopimelate desuccinylase-like protein
MLALVEALNIGKLHTRKTILFVADVGEEGIGNLRGIHYLFDKSQYRDRLDAFISIDGADDTKITSREIGSRRYRLTISGPGGHSWENFGRVNPAHALGRVIGQLSDLEVATDPKTTYNVGRIGGGTSVNSVPFDAWLEFDMRSADEQTLVRLEEKFLAIVKAAVDQENRMRAQSGTKLTYDAKRIGLRHAIADNRNEALVRAVHAADEALGVPRSQEEAGSTDSNAAANAGKPAITLGGGGKAGNFHSLEEWFEPENAWRGVQRVLLTVLAYDSQ